MRSAMSPVRPGWRRRGMAYDEPSYRRHTVDSPETGDPSGYRTGSFPAAPDYRGRRQMAESALRDLDDATTRRGDAVTTDLATGSEGRDRLGIHLGWEAVLL